MPHRRRKIHGLYFHSSPPRVLPMNNPMSIKVKDDKGVKDAIVIKPSNIRIWIHDKDIGKLTKVLWEGHGMRLRTETSSNPKVKKLLDSIPYVTNLIKDIHTATIDNDLETLKAKTQPPVPRIVLSSKDANGLTALHKASGLAHTRLVEYLLSLWPAAAAEVDNSGRTPLHYAASAKNNDRCFNLLVQAGSDETQTDHKHRTANFYKNKPHELDRSLLTVVPEAPRISQAQPISDFDWGILGEENIAASQGDITTNGDTDTNGNSSLNRVSKLPRPTFYSEQNINMLAKDPPAEENIIQKSESAHDQIGLENSSEDNIDNTSEPDLNAETPETTVLQGNDLDSGDADNPADTITENFEDDKVSLPITHSDIYQAPNHADGQNGNTARHEDEDERYSVDGDIEGDEYDTDSDQHDDDANAKNRNRLNPENDHISNNIDNNDNDNENEDHIDNEKVQHGDHENEDHIVNEHNDEVINDKNSDNNEDDTQDDTNQIEDNVSTREFAQDVVEVNDELDKTNDNEKIEDDNVNINNNDEAENNNVDNEKTDENINNNVDGRNSDNEIDKNQTILDENQIVDDDLNNDDDDDKAELLIIDQDEENSDKETENHLTEDENIHKHEGDKIEKHDDDGISSHDADHDDPNDDQMNDERKSKHSTTDDDDDVVNEHDIESPSPALEIQGVVKGEPSESGQLQSQGGLLSNEDEDARLQAIIDSGDMEQLASLVLCGDGAKLVGMTSDSPEIQAFLDNVTAYMNKIRKVHLAAREGNLRDLQSALDRRKFAIAKDRISPNGATPLHVAAIFGHSSIVRYLAGRFPETTSAVDNNGRTALHYAASVHDNGHFYNLLVHLGANPKVEDNSGYTPEFYLNHEKAAPIFSHKQLLRDYGVEEQTVDEMLSDQETRNERNSQPVEIPLFRTEEGRYLASSLGDPLIKGLTEVANKRPEDPITFLANYLFNFANTKKTETFKDSAIIENEENNNDENEMNQNKKTPELQQAEQVQTVNEEIMEKGNEFQSNKIIENHLDEYPSSSDGPEAAPTSEDRDEHGQSMLHFACARSHGRNGLIQLIEESGTSITFRDELYRSARDVSLQANQPDNAKEIDRYVLSLAARGDLETFQHFVVEGYDHILDVTDNDGNSIIEIAQSRRNSDLVDYLKSIRNFEEVREKFHKAIRQGDLEEVQRLSKRSEGSRLVRAKNYYGRCALHIAILKENEEIVEYLATNFKHALRVGDNLERTSLHYSMGVTSVEILSRILIRNGAKRVLKDLKGRQPSYYFMNKADILRLQEEEDH